MKSKWIWVLLAGVLGSASYAGNVLATPGSPPPAPTTTILGQSPTTMILGQSLFNSFRVEGHAVPAHWRARIEAHGLSDLYVVDNKFAPGATTGWHSHPGPSLILVVSGTVTNYTTDNPGCQGHAYSAGQGFIDAGGNDVHMLRNDGSIPAETIAVQLIPHGAPRKIDVPPPTRCPS
jgi:quercetin dioxygenase-like cupin family protein